MKIRFGYRRADAAEVSNHFCVSCFVDEGVGSAVGEVECSIVRAARQIVSERWSEGGGLKHLSVTATSAFDSTKRRVISRRPLEADSCSGVCRLKKSKRISLRKPIIIIKTAAITRWPSPPHQRCTGAKDDKLPGRLFHSRGAPFHQLDHCHLLQTNATEFLHCRKAKESTCANRVSLHKNNNNDKGGGNYLMFLAFT
jgi:hypothetical protein